MDVSAEAHTPLQIAAAHPNMTERHGSVHTHKLNNEKTLHDGIYNTESQELIGAKAGSAAWKASQSTLAIQVRQLQGELKESQNDMQKQLALALSENADLQASLKEETELVFELRGRVEQVGNVKDATRELARQNKALEARIQMLQTTLAERQRNESELAKQVAEEASVSHKVLLDLEKALNERANAVHRAEKAEQEASLAKEEAHAVRTQSAGTAAEQAAATVWLAEQRGDALRRILSLVGNHYYPNSDTLDCPPDDVGERALEAVKTFCENLCSTQESWAEERENLATQLLNTQNELQALLAARSMEDATQVSTALTHEEVAEVAARATAATLEAAQLKGQVTALEELVEQANTKAAAAEEEARELRNGAASKEERTKEMRAAAAEAVRQNKILCDGVQTAAHTVVDHVLNAAAALQIPRDSRTQSADALSASLADAVYTAADALEAVATNSADPTEFGQCVGLALQALCQGYSSMSTMVVERQKVHAALSAALHTFMKDGGDGNVDATTSDSGKGAIVSATTSLGDTITSIQGLSSSNIALDSLLEAVLAHVSTLIEEMHAEKKASESEVEQLRDAHSGLHSQLQALRRVLQIADRGDALVELAVAQRRVEELEFMCKELAERGQTMQQVADDARLSAARDWSDVKADVAQLVQHAERAQIDAEAAVQRQRAETAKLVSEAKGREHAACGARSEAEGKCCQLREELAGVVHELQNARADAIQAEQRAAAAEERLACVQRDARKEEVPLLDQNRKEEGNNNAVVQDQQQQTDADVIVVDLRDKLAHSNAELEASIRRAAAAEAAAAQHLAALGAASKQVQQADAQIAAVNNKVAYLELTLLTLESQEHAHNTPDVAAPPSPSIAPNAAPCPVPLVQAPPPFPVMPPSRDASVLQGRLDAAVSQIESLRALNRNLEEQLSTAVEAFGGSSQAMPAKPGLSACEVLDAAEKERKASQGRLDSVVSMWKEACASRDARILEVEAKLRVSSAEATSRTAEVATLQALQKAATAESEASQKLSCDLRSRLVESKLAQEALQQEVNAGKKAQVDAKRAREQLGILQDQIAAAQGRIGALERSLENARSASAQTAEQLRILEGSEARARAAEGRAAAAEFALAQHLDLSSQSSAAASLGKQLETAWATERDLVQKVQDLRSEVAEARGAVAAAERDAEAQAARCCAFQAQLAEAIGALEEQGAALEAFQGALMRAHASGDAAP